VFTWERWRKRQQTIIQDASAHKNSSFGGVMRCSCVCSAIPLPTVGLCLLVSTYRGGKYRSGAVSQVSDIITAALDFRHHRFEIPKRSGIVSNKDRRSEDQEETLMCQDDRMRSVEPRRGPDVDPWMPRHGSSLSACPSYVATHHQRSAPFTARSPAQHTATGQPTVNMVREDLITSAVSRAGWLMM
jgi:hypothetical protein